MSLLFIQGISGAPASLSDYNSNVNLTENSFSDLGPYIISGLAISAGVGLSASVATGVALIGGRLTVAATVTITGLTDATTNHLYLLNTGAGTSNTTGTQPANSVKLGTCTTAGGVVTAVQQNWTSGRQLRVRQDLEVHGGGAGHPRAIDLASWHATANEGNETKGVLPAGAIPASSGDLNGVGAFGSRPASAAGNLGNTYWPNDGVSLAIDTGSIFEPFGPVFPFNPPVNGDFSWINQGSATVTAERDSILLVSPAAGTGTSGNFRVKTATLTGSDYTVSAYFLHNILTDKQYPKFGMFFKDSGTKMVSFHIAAGQIWLTKWTSPTAISADYSNRGFAAAPGVWLRIRDDTTNLIFYISGDGRQWTQVESRARHDFLADGPGQIGFFTESQNAGLPNYEASCRLMSWKES